LAGIVPSQITGQPEIFIKTPTSLRKKIGVATYSSSTNTYAALYPDVRLMVGDFYRVGTEDNVFNILDIAPHDCTVYRAFTASYLRHTLAA
jgi:hypothetical protein